MAVGMGKPSVPPARPKNPMAPPRRGWAARTTEEARASGGPHPEGRNEMEQLGEAGLAARRGGPSRERRPDPRRGRPEKSAPPRQRRPLVSGRSPRIAMRDEAAEPA